MSYYHRKVKATWNRAINRLSELTFIFSHPFLDISPLEWLSLQKIKRVSQNSIISEKKSKIIFWGDQFQNNFRMSINSKIFSRVSGNSKLIFKLNFSSELSLEKKVFWVEFLKIWTTLKTEKVYMMTFLFAQWHFTVFPWPLAHFVIKWGAQNCSNVGGKKEVKCKGCYHNFQRCSTL